MIKKIILFFVLFYFINPCLASNLLQQTYETNNAETEVKYPISHNKIYLIKEDYYGYMHGKKALYGGILFHIEELKKSNNPDKELNLQYLNLVKTKYEKIILLQNNSIDNNMRLNTLTSKIIIDDADYKRLTTETKDLIQIINTIFSMD